MTKIVISSDNKRCICIEDLIEDLKKNEKALYALSGKDAITAVINHLEHCNALNGETDGN